MTYCSYCGTELGTGGCPNWQCPSRGVTAASAKTFTPNPPAGTPHAVEEVRKAYRGAAWWHGECGDEESAAREREMFDALIAVVRAEERERLMTCECGMKMSAPQCKVCDNDD